VDEVPITSITNGVHTATWLAPELADLLARHLGADWYDHVDEPLFWQGIAHVPDEELWDVHQALRSGLIAFARERLARQRIRLGEGLPAVKAAAGLLKPDTLTLGFARRFATYKRATLLFRDPKRLARILSDPQRPVQIVFAGKAHPGDAPGQQFIRQVYEFSRQPEFEGKVVFLEDYDIDMARHLVSGVDVWLNTPTRPLEASGTSGQKASLNAVPNCSILDGWWEEGYNGANGWAIGERREYVNDDTRDETDALSLYDVLEHQIVPQFYDRDAVGIPHHWVAVMKEAMRTLAPAFSMRRMLKEYAERLYVPALQHGSKMDAVGYERARELAAWKQRARQAWGEVSVDAEGPRDGQYAVGEPITVRAFVRLGSLAPEDVAVALVTSLDDNGTLSHLQTVPMRQSGRGEGGALRYEAQIVPDASGSLVYGVRILPHHRVLANPFELGLGRWA
jgi:glycogen phosphorylase